jgi:hypothetical protein
MVARVKKAMKWVGAVKEGSKMLLGKDLSRAVSSRAVQAVQASPPAYAKGGVVKKTGKALVHRGEKVLTLAQRKALKKLSGL